MKMTLVKMSRYSSNRKPLAARKLPVYSRGISQNLVLGAHRGLNVRVWCGNGHMPADKFRRTYEVDRSDPRSCIKEHWNVLSA